MTTLEAHMDIDERHWVLWARDAAQRCPPAVDWYRQQSWSRPELTGYRQHSDLDGYVWEEGDEEVAAAIGRGMWAMAREGMKRHCLAVAARYRAEGVERQVVLASRWGVTTARVTQLANEGMRWVEAWCMDEYPA